MTQRWNDWFAQAEHDLEQADSSLSEGRHDWACFAAHQAAEKAVKALHPEGAPFEHYGPLQSRQGVDFARDVVEFVRQALAGD